MERMTADITTTEIRLDAVLKFAGAVETGGEAKYLIQNGHVLVNRAQETRRSTRVRPGDTVEIIDAEGTIVVVVDVRVAEG